MIAFQLVIPTRSNGCHRTCALYSSTHAVVLVHRQSRCKAAATLACACSRNPLAVQFYEFIRTLDTCKSSIAHNTTLIVSTDSDLFRLLQNTTH